jgi:Leucine-rich repeat (LRR) protein/Tfp pilus assembly protein PilV
MLTTSNVKPAVTTFTPAQRSAAFVEHTADLDKAEVLQNSIPTWLVNADIAVVQGLKAAVEQSDLTYTKAAQVLQRLKPLDVFCKEQLTLFLKSKWTVDFDVERDTLEIVKRSIIGISTPLPTSFQEKFTTTSRSLLHAAMENFTLEESRSGGIPKDSVIRINGQAQTGAAISPTKFALICRELDLGARYQRHIAEVLALPATSASNANASAADIRQLKLLDLKVAVHIAYLKKHITEAVYTMMLSVIAQKLPAAKTKGAVFDGGLVIWQGLMIHDACICGALVFTKASIDTAPKAKCVVYLPNDPERPLYEYASLDDFKAYLSRQLQTKAYRAYFAGQFLPGHDKSDFFTAFDEDNVLGTLVATPADCVADFFFGAFISKTQRDARALAVTTEEVDEVQREKTVQRLLDGGLLFLNAASFFVPVLGELMMAVAVIDIVSEVYEGVQDWAHGEPHKALSHLLNVVENIAQMAAFAAAGKVASTALRRVAKEQAAFFDDFEAVTRADGKQRLWKPDLEPYKQVSALPDSLRPDAKGIYKVGERTSIVMEEAAYGVTRNADKPTWQINHPVRQDAFSPGVERSVEGGWRHEYEHAHEWPNSGYALKRTDPRLNGFSDDDLTKVANIVGMSPAELHRLHLGNFGFPPRLNDCIERFKLNRRITEMVSAMERAETANTDFLQEQLHTLPRLPGWPKERFIEVLDDEGDVISRYPKGPAKEDDDVNSVHVTQAQLDAGQLLDTVVDGLYTKEVEAIIGKASTDPQAKQLAKKMATSLQSNRQPLFDWLYKTYDGDATGDVATLQEHASGVPTRLCQELLDNSSNRDRVFLRMRKHPGFELGQQIDEAQSSLRLDRALCGLHFPQMANIDTDTLSLRLMDRVQGWETGYRLELRQESVAGNLLDSVGSIDAPLSGVIIKTSTGYRVNQGTGTLMTHKTSATLAESIFHALPASRRIRMGLTGTDDLSVTLLRERLVTAATANRARTTRVLRGEQREVPEHLSSCAQADPPAATVYAKALIRKVRKLYPQFTDAQISAFLDEAGNTHTLRLNRIRTLEQQLKKLRSVLRIWSHDQVEMKKVPGQLNDVRVSRRQVAQAIENCWRRISAPLLPHDQTSMTLKLERNPSGPLPTLTEQDVAHVRNLSIRDMNAGDELAYFLGPFKNLVRLELDGNQLTRLPEALSYMPDLEHLILNRNQVALTEHTLRKLADMRKLRTLGLTGNRLGATLNISKMLDLQSLFLGDTHTTELPVGLSRLPYLEAVDLRGNDIRELPAWLFDVPRRFARRINLRHNPLSASSRTKLETYRNSTGIGMGFLEDDHAVINEQKAREFWMPDSREENYASRDRTWAALKNEPESDGFFRLLAEVGNTADNRYVHEAMTDRVWSVIEAAGNDSALRDRLLPLAVRASCVDSAATIFSNLEVTVDIDRLVSQSANTQDQAARLLNLGRRLFRQDYLARLAREHVLANPKLDPVEVELAYRTGLADRLELLGQPRHMRYASLGGVTSGHLEGAYKKVVAAEATSELSADVSNREFWGKFLREQYDKKFTDLAAPYHERVQTAFENETTLGTGFRAHIDAIADELQQAETGLLKSLTEQAIEAEKMKTCFILD